MYKNKFCLITVPLSEEKHDKLLSLTKELKYKSKTQMAKLLLEGAIDDKTRKSDKDTEK